MRSVFGLTSRTASSLSRRCGLLSSRREIKNSLSAAALPRHVFIFAFTPILLHILIHVRFVRDYLRQPVFSSSIVLVSSLVSLI